MKQFLLVSFQKITHIWFCYISYIRSTLFSFIPLDFLSSIIFLVFAACFSFNLLSFSAFVFSFGSLFTLRHFVTEWKRRKHLFGRLHSHLCLGTLHLLCCCSKACFQFFELLSLKIVDIFTRSVFFYVLVFHLFWSTRKFKKVLYYLRQKSVLYPCLKMVLLSALKMRKLLLQSLCKS